MSAPSLKCPDNRWLAVLELWFSFWRLWFPLTGWISAYRLAVWYAALGGLVDPVAGPLSGDWSGMCRDMVTLAEERKPDELFFIVEQ